MHGVMCGSHSVMIVFVEKQIHLSCIAKYVTDYLALDTIVFPFVFVCTRGCTN